MSKQIEVSYVSVIDEKELESKFAEILVEGLYCYLKSNGLLKEDAKRNQEIQELLEETKRIDTSIVNEEIEGPFKNN